MRGLLFSRQNKWNFQSLKLHVTNLQYSLAKNDFHHKESDRNFEEEDEPSILGSLTQYGKEIQFIHQPVANGPVKSHISLSRRSLIHDTHIANNSFDDHVSQSIDDNHIRLKRAQPHQEARYMRLLSRYRKTSDSVAASNLFNQLLDRDRILPTRFQCHQFIDCFAQSADSENAFRVYKKMTELSIEPTQATFSRLFRKALQFSVSSDQFRQKFDKSPALQRTLGLWWKLRSRQLLSTTITYNTLIMALARAGEFRYCLRALDEMESPNSSNYESIRPDAFTLSALFSSIEPASLRGLLSAPSNSLPNPFVLALTLWHRLAHQPHIKLTGHQFSALIDIAALPVRQPVLFPPLPLDTSARLATALPAPVSDPVVLSDSQILPVSRQEIDWTCPALVINSPTNLLVLRDHPVTILPPSDGWRPHHFLILMGGLRGLVNSMQTIYRTPVKLILIPKLIALLPPPSTTSTNDLDVCETELFSLLKDLSLKPDIAIYNALVNRRCSRGLSAAFLVGHLVSSGLQPDQITWGCLARGCQSVSAVKELLNAMQTMSCSSSVPSQRSLDRIRPSLAFFASLLGASRFNWQLKAYVLELMSGNSSAAATTTDVESIQPDRKFLASLDVDIALFRQLLAKGVIPSDMASELEVFVGRYFNESGTINVITSDGRSIVGTLKGFDNAINLIIRDSHERVFSLEDGVEQVPLGLFVVRGQNVAIVGEVDEDLDRRIDLSQIRAEPLDPIVH